MLPPYPVSLSPCLPLPSPCLLVSLSPCLLVSLSPCLPVSLSPCLLKSLSPCLSVPCLPVSLSPCNPVSLSPCLSSLVYRSSSHASRLTSPLSPLYTSPLETPQVGGYDPHDGLNCVLGEGWRLTARRRMEDDLQDGWKGAVRMRWH